MIVTAEDDMDEHVPSSVLTGIKEKIVVTDLINQLDIADGLKELLMGGGFTLKSLLNASASDLAKILSIDEYVACKRCRKQGNKKEISTVIYCMTKFFQSSATM